MYALILFNGPPRCGKDTAARIVCEYFHTYKFKHEKFSLPIKRAFAGTMDTPITPDGTVLYYEQHKEEIIPPLGVSYRQWQIDFAESFMKRYNKQIFARLLFTRMITPNCSYVVSDCGFQLEVEALAEYIEQSLNPTKMLICPIYGRSHVFDSREYVTAQPNHLFQPLINDGDLMTFRARVIDVVKHYLSEVLT